MKSSRSNKASKRTARLSDQGGPRVDYKKTVLPNGIKVLTERHPLSRAVSCGVWVDKGTRDENSKEAGIAHFVEHLVFKRTANRNAYEISRDMDAVGGDLNAFTSREYTSFVSHSLKEHVGLSLDILSDLVCRPSFDAGDIKKEKQVVVQEIHMSEDQIEDCIFDYFFDRIYPTSALGKPILGSVKSIEGMKRETILDFHRRQYTYPNLMVSVAGNVQHDEVVKLATKYLKFPKGDRTPAKAPAPPEATPEFKPFREVIQRPSEQAHILMGLPTADLRDRLRFAGFLVNTLLGGGMTSKLYQTVREERGLVYTIYSQLSTFKDAGVNLIYAGTQPKNAQLVCELVMKEIKKLRRDGITRKDLSFYKTQINGQILLGADDIENRMNSLAVNEMVFGRYRSVDDVVNDIENVTLDAVHEYIETYLDPEQIGMLLMGAVKEKPTRKWVESL